MEQKNVKQPKRRPGRTLKSLPNKAVVRTMHNTSYSNDYTNVFRLTKNNTDLSNGKLPLTEHSSPKNFDNTEELN